MISVSHKGSFSNLQTFLNRNKKIDVDIYLNLYGQKGVEALANATPRDTGKTANSWRYEIEKDEVNQKITVRWLNDNVVDDWFNVALMLQYGHATGSGYWIEGRDYINPAIQSIFDKMAEEIWKEITLA